MVESSHRKNFLVFHEKLMTTYIPIIHMEFHKCEHVQYCDQI